MDKLIGIFAAVAANVIFGLNIPVTKALIAGWMTPAGYTMTRMFFGTAVFWLIASLFNREKASGRDLIIIMIEGLIGYLGTQFLFSALVLLPLSPFELPGQRIYSQEGTLPALSLLGFALIFSTTLAFFFMPLALKKLEASTVSIFMNLQPIVASVVAIGIGQDTFTWDKSLAALLVLSGVYLVSVNKTGNPLKQKIIKRAKWIRLNRYNDKKRFL